MCLREKIGPDPRNFNQRVSLGRNDLLIRTFPNPCTCLLEKDAIPALTPNSPQPPSSLFPIPCTRKLVQRTKTVKDCSLLSPGTFKPGDQRIVTEIRPGVAGSYTPAVRVRVHPRICEASHWLHALPGSPCGMERARLRTIPDTQLHNAEWLLSCCWRQAQ